MKISRFTFFYWSWWKWTGCIIIIWCRTCGISLYPSTSISICISILSTSIKSILTYWFTAGYRSSTFLSISIKWTIWSRINIYHIKAWDWFSKVIISCRCIWITIDNVNTNTPTISTFTTLITVSLTLWTYYRRTCNWGYYNYIIYTISHWCCRIIFTFGCISIIIGFQSQTIICFICYSSKSICRTIRFCCVTFTKVKLTVCCF